MSQPAQRATMPGGQQAEDFRAGQTATMPQRQPQQGFTRQAAKRPLPAEDDEANAQRSKRQRTEEIIHAADLDDVILSFESDKGPVRSGLNMFGDHTFPNKLRPHHYDYDRFRVWLREHAALDPSDPVMFKYRGQDGSVRGMGVSNRYEFNALLVGVNNHTFKPFFDSRFGYVLVVSPSSTKASALRSASPQQVKPQQRLHNDAAGSVQGPSAPVQNETNSAVAAEATPPAQTVGETGASTPAVEVSDDDAESVQGADYSGPRLDDFDNVTFRKALRFFQTTEVSDGRCAVLRGCKLQFHDYQIYRTYCALMAPIESGVNGTLIDWGVGYGKTILSLIYLQARSRLATRWDRVRAEWKKPPEGNHRHLPENNRDKSAKCPTQGNTMIECPCVFGSDSRRICETYLTNTPALIIVIPGLGQTWVNDMEKAFEEFYRGGSPVLNLYTYMSDLTGENSVAKGGKNRADIIARTSAKQVDDVDEEQLRSMITKGDGTAKDVFLVTNHTVQRLRNLYPSLTTDQRKKLFTMGVVFMDEFQKYQGKDGRTDTQSFALLKEISGIADHPITLFTLSGTTIDEGPSAWRAPVEHFRRQWDDWSERLTDRNDLSPNDTLCRLDDIRKQYNSLLRRLALNQVEDSVALQEAAAIRAVLALFVTTLRPNQIYRNRPVNPLPAKTERLMVVEPQMDARTKGAFNSFITSVSTLMNQRLVSATAEWKKKKKVADDEGSTYDEPEPTLQSLMADLASGVINLKGSDSFRLLQRSSMYPYLAALMNPDENGDNVDTEMVAATESKAAQAPAVQCQRALFKGETREAAQRCFDTWEFEEHLDQIVANSAKYAAIKQLIKKMIADDDPATNPPDGSGKRHAVLFCSQTISSAITYRLLLRDEELKDIIEPMLISSEVPTAERQQIIDKFTSNCTPKSRNKVLVAMLSITAEGYNIQRANNVWFAELPTTYPKKNQGVGRANRQGQKMNVSVEMLQEVGNLMEEYGYQMMSAREKIQSMIYSVKMAS